MVVFLLLRLKSALQEPWVEDVPALRRAVVAGSVDFAGLRGVVDELIPFWTFVRYNVRFTRPHDIESAVETVRLACWLVFYECLAFVYVVLGA